MNRWLRPLLLGLCAGVWLVTLALGVASEARAAECDPSTDPACETVAPEPTGSPSPVVSSTPEPEASPTPTPSPAPSGPDCSREAPCTVDVSRSEDVRDFMGAMTLAAGALVLLVSVHVVGSWRR